MALLPRDGFGMHQFFLLSLSGPKKFTLVTNYKRKTRVTGQRWQMQTWRVEKSDEFEKYINYTVWLWMSPDWNWVWQSFNRSTARSMCFLLSKLTFAFPWIYQIGVCQNMVHFEDWDTRVGSLSQKLASLLQFSQGEIFNTAEQFTTWTGASFFNVECSG